MVLLDIKVISINLNALSKETNISKKILEILKSRNVLTPDNIDFIERQTEERSLIFYTTLISCQEPFLGALKEAFQETEQDIPLKIIDPKITCEYNDKNCLGTGSNGTKVYRGEFKGNLVAVKIIYGKLPHDTLGEITKMKNMEEHSNVLKLLYSEFDYRKECHMLALEYCEGSLNDWMRNKEKFSGNSYSKKQILEQCTKGLAHLHKKDINIIHADLIPANVLLCLGCIKIADFGISKYLNGDRNCITLTSDVGTKRYRAPEVLRFIDERQKINPTSIEKITVSHGTDIFALGCIFYELITENHPFGKIDSEIHANIMANNPTMNENQCDFEFFQNGSVQLMKKMVAHNEDDRPPAKHVLLHPTFWNEHKSLKFLIDIGNMFMNKTLHNSSFIWEIESKWMTGPYSNTDINDNSWKSLLCPVVSNYLILYPGRSIFELLRLIKTLWEEFRVLPQAVKDALGSSPEKFMEYWNNRFPWLVHFMWQIFENPPFQPSTYSI